MALSLIGALHLETVRATVLIAAKSAAGRAAGALVSGMWQGVLLSAATGLVLRWIPGSTATLRFVVWVTVFCLAVAMPFASLHSPLSSAGPAGSHLMLDPRWSYLLAAAWAIASMHRLVDLARQTFRIRALWRSALPVTGLVMAKLDATLLASGRKAELCTSDHVDRPSVIGFFAPRILIPASLFERLTAIELNHIVLHEVEHLRRRDDWVNLLLKIGLVLLPLNPALFWIDRRLSTERELACDDGVLERTKMPRAYATSLTSIAGRRLDLRLHSRLGTLALAATGLKQKRSELGKRIERILSRRQPVNRRFASGLAAVLVAGAVGSSAVLVRAPQLVSFGANVATQSGIASANLGLSHGTVSAMQARPAMAPAPTFQNVSFHLAESPRIPKTKPPAKVVRAGRALHLGENPAVAPAVQKQFVVLTSWEDAPVSRVFVQTLDGKFLLTPYAAVPTQAGWLLVQL